jgi:3-carboxy-cis,cis-muconate cycloisomerase
MSALSLVDSPLFGSSFVDLEMRALFDSDAFVARCVEVELALARAEARLGVIPEAAARDIADAAQTYAFDHARLQRETEVVGYPILPIVEQLADATGEGGRYLHWGATTQDIMDTAKILQVRSGLELIERRLAETIAALRRLAEAQRDTPMTGRTHLQHA